MAMRLPRPALLASLAVVLLAPAIGSAQRYRPPPPPPGYYGRAPAWRGGPYDSPRPPYPRRYRPCGRGTEGTIIGAIAGGLLGNSIARGGDRPFGTVVGAGAGALAGRAIGRDC